MCVYVCVCVYIYIYIHMHAQVVLDIVLPTRGGLLGSTVRGGFIGFGLVYVV